SHSVLLPLEGCTRIYSCQAAGYRVHKGELSRSYLRARIPVYATTPCGIRCSSWLCYGSRPPVALLVNVNKSPAGFYHPLLTTRLNYIRKNSTIILLIQPTFSKTQPH